MESLLPRIGVVLIAIGVLTACGGGDDAGGSDDQPSTAETTESVSYDGTSPEDLLSCLTDAGLPAVVNDATPILVEVPVSGVDINPLGDDPDQGVDLWVFTDPAAAEDNRVNITLSVEDTPTSWISGNVIVQYFRLPSSDDAAVSAVDGCLPE